MSVKDLIVGMQQTAPSRNKILSLRANYTGNNVECLLEDENGIT